MLTTTFEIRTETGTEQVPVSFAIEPSEITVGQWHDYQIYVSEKKPECMTREGEKKHDWSPWDFGEFILFMAEIVSIFCNEDMGFLIRNLPLGNIERDQAGAASLASIYNQIISSINNYQPEMIGEFEFRGKKFKIPEKGPESTGGLFGHKMKVIEVVEALNAEHFFSRPQAETGVPLPGYKLRTELHMISCVCRRIVDDQGNLESIPTTLTDWQEFIHARSNFFDKLPMSTALGVRFFLTVSKIRSRLIHKPS